MTQKPHKKLNDPAQQSSRRSSSRARTRWIAAAGAAAAGAAIFNRIMSARAQANSPPVGTFVEVDGVRLHYIDRGEGDVVVLLHGNGVTLQDFAVSGVVGLAAERHRVLAFDRPGFGYSERPRNIVWTPAAQADLIARALVQIGIESAVIVGHSWGAMVALAMALDHPAVVRRLVLVSGYYYGTARPDVLGASLPAVPLLGDFIANTISPLAGRLIAPAGIKASFSPAPVSDKFAEFPVGLTLRPSQIRATAADTAMMVPSAMALSRRYGELALPVIVLAGDGDLIAHKDKHAERLIKDIDRAELRIVPSQGHLLHYAVPEQVVAAIDGKL
jgi:pimeloyl-ACP methyl ester carboxylesterase